MDPLQRLAESDKALVEANETQNQDRFQIIDQLESGTLIFVCVVQPESRTTPHSHSTWCK
jgi:hypothetical protein